MIDISTLNFPEIIGSIIVGIGVISPYLISKYNSSKLYLDIINGFLDMLNEYYTDAADGNFTEIEYAAIGKKFVAFAKTIHNNNDIPAQISAITPK